MKFLNKVLCLTAFFAMGSVSAKPTGAARTAVTAPGKPAVTSGDQKQKTFKQLRDQVLGMKQSDVIDNKTGLLSASFIQQMINDVSASISSTPARELLALETLLKVARDRFLQFSGDNQKDLTSLSIINGQIKTIVDRLNK